jgi:regulator of protease activity HflC (stomatin/prohibitin superfamily)
MEFLWVYGLAIVALIVLFRMVRVVPEAHALVVEELGKYKKTLGPGMHLVIPLIQRVAYKHELKEEVLDVHPQVCITQDNVQVTVDGVLYFKVVDAFKASYGIENYKFATIQLAQTTMRSEIGKIVLDKTFSEREAINNAVVKSIDKASEPWGIKVTRYEIRDIEPSASVIEALEQQMEAERRKRAEILESEGEKESRINMSKGEREEAINLSMGERQKRINEAEGMARSMEIIAEATAQGIGMIADAIQKPKGRNALSLQIANGYIANMGKILQAADVSVLPMEAAKLQGLVNTIMPALGQVVAPPAQVAAPAPAPQRAPRGDKPAQ